ncbi:hypothetical protein CICLE_v10013914mg [Citrus x clementina]|uniref:Uncharacterized protein n=1 Tax=Citrus clementina TaxID=85681 RepID=V4UW55_CITCL|nr:hypothetical protein CICLE_v10013914mg [Citrus x clementina]
MMVTNLENFACSLQAVWLLDFRTYCLGFTLSSFLAHFLFSQGSIVDGTVPKWLLSPVSSFSQYILNFLTIWIFEFLLMLVLF